MIARRCQNLKMQDTPYVKKSLMARDATGTFASISDRLDVLINNAGIYPDEGITIDTLPRNLVPRTFQTNTFGLLEVTQAFLPFLRRAGTPRRVETSRVVNFSSGLGQLQGIA